MGGAGALAAASAAVWAKAPTWTLLALLTVAGACMATPFFVGISSWTMKRGGANMAALEGSSEMVAYSCAVLADIAVGAMADSVGWHAVLACWAALTGIAGYAFVRVAREE